MQARPAAAGGKGGDDVASRLAKINADLAAEKSKEEAKKKKDWNQKEKRKRDIGQASKDKNWVSGCTIFF